jgi:NTE family protein
MSATDMVFGANFVFDSGNRRVGDYQIGYAPFPDWPVARAVAASSCFPPVFNPLPLELDPSYFSGGDFDEPNRDELVGAVQLSDGGVYDNMGLEPVWKDHAHVLVSDGGAVFSFAPDKGLPWRVARYAAIAGRQGSAVRKRWLIANYSSGEMDGTYWGIGSSPDSYDQGRPGFSKAMATEVIANIRTDLDRFSDAEAQALRIHGYFLADAALDKHAAELISIPEAVTRPPPTAASEPEWRLKLAKSAIRKNLGRGFRPFR